MAENKTILVDMDDVLVDLLDAWIAMLNFEYGTNTKKKNIKEWDMMKAFPSLSADRIYSPLHEPYFWETVNPKKDAVTYLKKLIDDGYNVFVCTSTHYKTVGEKMEKALFEHFPYLTWKNLIITPDKTLINGDLLIDDGVHNLIGGKYKKILMDAPHNRAFEERESGIVRVKNWKEAYRETGKLLKKGE